MNGQQKRNRPRISTTLSPYTISILVQVAKERGFEKTGQTIDFITHDWIGLQRALHYSSPEMTEKYAEAMAETMAG